MEDLGDKYQNFDVKFEESIDKNLIDGEALFCYWDDPYPATQLRIKLKDKTNDENESKYRKELSISLNYEAERRKNAGEKLFGGGLIILKKGMVDIKWLSEEAAATAMDDDLYRSVINDLESKYFEILAKFDFNAIYDDENLSGIFLAMPDRSYISSDRKVMVIGQETKKWRNDSCDAKNINQVTINSVRESMTTSLEFNKKLPKKSKFRQFYKQASKSLCGNSLDPDNSAVWANQFCISYKSGSPIKSDKFETIKALSSELLNAQLEVLNPDVIFFTTGSARDKYIKDSFDYKTIDVIEPRRLWHFKIGDINCFRTNHPRSGYSPPYLKQAIVLANKIT